MDTKEFNTADILMGPMIVSVSTPMISFVLGLLKLTMLAVCDMMWYQTQMNIWIEKNIVDWPNKSAGPDLKEALKAPELEKFMRYHEKLANWSALTSTRKDCGYHFGGVRYSTRSISTDVIDVFAECLTASFKGASAKVKSMRESKH